MTTKATTNKFSPEVRERAVRMVQEHVGKYPTRWAAVQSIAAKIGCAAQTLHEWTKKAEVDGGKRAGLPSDVAEKLRALGIYPARVVVAGGQAVAAVSWTVLFQFQGSISCSRDAGWSLIRRSTSVSQARGSVSLSLAVTMSEYMAAARSPPRSEPQNS